jgi:hypothetical protein
MAQRGPKKVVLEDGTVTWVKSDGSPAKKPGRQAPATESAPKKIEMKKELPKMDEMVSVPAALITKMFELFDETRKERALEALEGLETRMSMDPNLDADGRHHLEYIREKIIFHRMKTLEGEVEIEEEQDLEQHASCPVPKAEVKEPQKPLEKVDAVGSILKYIHPITEGSAKAAVRIFAEKIYQLGDTEELQDRPFQVVAFIDARHELFRKINILKEVGLFVKALNGCVTLIVDGDISIEDLDSNITNAASMDSGVIVYKTVLEFNLPPQVEAFTPGQVQAFNTHPIFYMPQRVNLADDEVVVIL